MPKPRGKAASGAVEDDLLAIRPRKPIPHAFVLDALAPASPDTRPMFGCIAVYLGEKIVLALRDKRDDTAADDGVWLATTKEHHASLRRELPCMRSIRVFGAPVTGWQVLPVEADDFEQAAMRACELILAGDVRIGKVPKPRTPKRRAAEARKA